MQQFFKNSRSNIVVNVTPDKRTVFLHDPVTIAAALSEALQTVLPPSPEKSFAVFQTQSDPMPSPSDDLKATQMPTEPSQRDPYQREPSPPPQKRQPDQDKSTPSGGGGGGKLLLLVYNYSPCNEYNLLYSSQTTAKYQHCWVTRTCCQGVGCSEYPGLRWVQVDMNSYLSLGISEYNLRIK